MTRAFLIVLDSAGIGGAPDAAEFGDAGANTIGHIAETVPSLELPTLAALGLGQALEAASGMSVPRLIAEPTGRWAAATEVSRGKDTPSGHWELAGVPVPWDWHYFPNETPAIPQHILDEIARAAGSDGTLCNAHSSGIPVIAKHGAEHVETGRPIVYTSVDSVLQIAAHEETFGYERLLDTCRAVAPTLHAMRVGRVIARPFVGAPGAFERTQGRRDFAIPPPSPTLLDWAEGAGRATYGVGKIGDIFAQRGVGESRKGADADLMGHLDDLAAEAPGGALIFANLVEFDTLHGHQRDPEGYAAALMRFDAWLAGFLPKLRDGDLLAITADHGNDPTWRGTDHTRERVPVLIHGAGTGALGQCGFSDVGATVAAHLGLAERGAGKDLL